MLPGSEALSQLLGELYDAAADPSLWESFLRRLVHFTKATSAALVIYDSTQRSYTLSSSWQVDPEATRLYGEHYGSTDKWAHRALLKTSGSVCSSEELCPAAELSTTEWYNDFLTKFDIAHGLFDLVETGGSHLASISLYRDASREAFGHSEAEILRFLAPHVQQAFKLHMQFNRLTTRCEAFETALNSITTGIVFLGPIGQIVMMNRSAMTLTAEQDGLLATRDGLRAERPKESTLLASTIQQAASTSNGKGFSAGSSVLISRRTRPPLQVLISPIHNSMIPTSKSIAAVAFITDPLRPHRPTQAILRMLYGLSSAECRVALLLGDGRAPREIANTVGVTENTVRSQIKSIFSKTGVTRQAELVRLLLNNAGPTIQAQSDF